MSGMAIKFEYAVNFNGTPLDFEYTGTLDPAANTMKGSVGVAGTTGDFSATKK